MPLSEPVSVSEVMTLSESMSESVSEVHKNLVSVSEPTSEIEIFYLSESVSESMFELMSEPMSVSASEPLSKSNQVQSGRSQAVIVDGRAIVCFGHGLGHELMSELVSVSVHLCCQRALIEFSIGSENDFEDEENRK